MKNILYLLCFLPVIAIGQVSREKFSPLTYTDIVRSTDSALSPEEMYTRIITWVNTSFKNAKAVIEVQNKVAGLIILKGVIPFVYKSGIKDKMGEVRYTLKFEIKPGRARLQFFNYSGRSWDGYTQPLSNDEEPDIKNAGLFHSSFKKAWHAAKEASQKDHDDTINTLTSAINKRQDNW